MTRKHITGLIIASLLIIFNAVSIYIYEQETEELSDLIKETKSLKKDTVATRERYAERLDTLNQEQGLVQEYFKKREELSLLEIMFFLEYQYPTHSNNMTFSIRRKDNNTISYVTTNFDKILEMERNFNKWNEQWFLREFSWDTIWHESIWLETEWSVWNLYSIDISFYPNKIRDFLVNWVENKDIVPVQDQPILKYFYDINLLQSLEELSTEE